MDDMTLSEILSAQRELFELHKDKWLPLTPEHGRSSILFMVEEIGEAVAVLKKKGDQAIVDDPNVRAAFLEEMSDVMMYFADTLLRYGVSAEEFARVFRLKHAKNMGRDYEAEYRDKFAHSEFL